jgi:hypothetical protein
MSQLREDFDDLEDNFDPDAALKEQVLGLPRTAKSSGSVGDRPLNPRQWVVPALDRNLDDLSEIVRELKDEVLSITPDSAEYDRALYKYNRWAESYLHHATRRTKLAEKDVKGYDKLSTGQISQAKEEYRGKLYLTAIKICLSDRPGKDEHYLNKVARFLMIDACREVAKGHRSGKETLFLEQSGDAPIGVDEFEASSIIEITADDRTETDTYNSLAMLDLEQMAKEIAMKSRPDISLFECFKLYLDDYSLMDIARHFALPNLPTAEFDRFYTNLRRFVQHEKVLKLLKSYTGTIVIIISILMANRLDF